MSEFNCYKCMVECNNFNNDTFQISEPGKPLRYGDSKDGFAYVVAKNFIDAARIVGPNAKTIEYLGPATVGGKE